MQMMLKKCMALYLDMIGNNMEFDLTEEIYGLIIDLEDVRKFDPGQPRDDRGRWTDAGGGSSGSGGSSGGSSSGGGRSGGNRTKPPKMSRKEVLRVTHGIATDFPRLKADGVKRKYDFGNYSYDFYVQSFGSYTFVKKRRLK